jgi:phage FluMu protein Com
MQTLPIKCPACRRRWFDAAGEFVIDIKCPRCGMHFIKHVIVQNDVALYNLSDNGLPINTCKQDSVS